MLLREPPQASRQLLTRALDCDLVVVGGGMAGLCCAITAARAGLQVALIQDRPVLGGNASSEVRLWVLGATCHMGSNNRWAREGGVIDEILVENLWRNPEGNPLLFDILLLEKVVSEPNITLLLNTAVFELEKSDPDTVAAVRAFCSQNSTLYEVRAPLFCDASGDGIVGFLAGAAFRMGAEAREEFDEPFAPSGEFGHLLGHSLYFYTKDTGRPVKFIPPSFALSDIPQHIPRYKSFNTATQGCRLWWIEWGGRLDTVHDTERIKWELWKVVYGVWDYIKNSGNFPDAETLTLEWVGHIPGKRESRRFEAPHILTQKDLVWRPHHDDAVAFGGWSIDLHPADGVFSELAGSHHLHSKGIYQIPYRCYYSRNIRNLFLAGRIISASHVAFGSTRVMATCAHGAQAVGMAAALCRRAGCLPAEVDLKQLQRELLRLGQHIPGYRLDDPDDLARSARLSASSRFMLEELPADGPLWRLDKQSVAQLLPVAAGPMPALTVFVDAQTDTELVAELRTTGCLTHHTPDVLLARQTVPLTAGAALPVSLRFDAAIDQPRYVFVCLLKNERLAVRCAAQRVSGLLTLVHSRDETTAEVGGENYQVWIPQRRPGGHNFALRIEPPIDVFGPDNVVNGVSRPTHQPNAWVAGLEDPRPTLQLRWSQPQTIAGIELGFDTDFDHAMESVLMGHPERAMPFCVRHYRILDQHGALIAERDDNHQTRNLIALDPPVSTAGLNIEVLDRHGGPPAAVFEVRCYESADRRVCRR
jgi:hypothetical protein